MNKQNQLFKRFDILFFIFLFVVSIFLSFDLLYKNGKPTTPGVFYSDKSHYYVYLPATLIYGWEANNFPKKTDTLFSGFVLDSASNKVVIKVTCGVAILCSPFFLATHTLAHLTGAETTGFGEFYEKGAVIPPIFFFILGLWFLKRFLDHYFKRYLSYLVILLIAAGTNLYHYALVEGWMSHIFGFFLFASVLYYLKRFLDDENRPFSRFLWIAILISLAVLIRPTNILLVLWLALLDSSSFSDVWKRIRFFIQPKYVVSFLIVGLIVFTPQFFYWYYLSGKFIYFSYPGEGFYYWKNPMMVEVWFAQLNGLFVYNPIVFFMVAGMVLMILKKISNGWFLLAFFLINTYIIGSWHAWFFGGSFGSRPFAEFFALFALAFGYMLNGIFGIRNLFLRSTLVLLLLLTVLYNQRLVYNPWWNTSSTWAWDDFRDLLDIKNILHSEKKTYTWVQDFENISFDPSVQKTQLNYRSETRSCLVTRDHEFACHYEHGMGPFLDQKVKQIKMECWIDPYLRDSCGGLMVSMIVNENGEPFLYKAISLDENASGRTLWHPVTTGISVPAWLNDPGYKFVFYLWNKKKTDFMVDDIRIRFE